MLQHIQPLVRETTQKTMLEIVYILGLPVLLVLGQRHTSFVALSVSLEHKQMHLASWIELTSWSAV